MNELYHGTEQCTAKYKGAFCISFEEGRCANPNSQNKCLKRRIFDGELTLRGEPVEASR